MLPIQKNLRGRNPLYPTLLTCLLVISLVLSKEGQHTSVQMAAQGWSALCCMDRRFWEVHKDIQLFPLIIARRWTSPNACAHACKIPLRICTITINIPAKKGWERVLQNLNSLWNKIHEERLYLRFRDNIASIGFLREGSYITLLPLSCVTLQMVRAHILLAAGCVCKFNNFRPTTNEEEIA